MSVNDPGVAPDDYASTLRLLASVRSLILGGRITSANKLHAIDHAVTEALRLLDDARPARSQVQVRF